ncbi:SDR family oxidoreductase [Pantoea cypripedii]|uniref:SDR family oxidoreductase n=1 Tax=Pantoea cypripedii TaxID=55209 RepID=UPI002FC8E244
MSLVLIIGATGSVGRHVVTEALNNGHMVRVLTRKNADIRKFPADIEQVTGDLTDINSLYLAVKDVDAIIFTHGTHGYEKQGFEQVDYGGVKNVIQALEGRPVHIALMTAIGVTVRSTMHDWKRRAERLVRASSCRYTIVRPGWFDYNAANQLKLVALQGDNRRDGSPKDGVISRHQIAQVLVNSISLPDAWNKTFELVAETGPATEDFVSFFRSVDQDGDGVDAIHDRDNMPMNEEPERVVSAMHAAAPTRITR